MILGDGASMTKKRIIGGLTKIAVGTIDQKLLAEATKLVNNQLEKRKGYLHVPDVVSLPITEAGEALEKYGFNYGKFKVTPQAKYANLLPNVVFKVKPRIGSAVPPDTFIKVYFADQQVIADSQQLAAAAAEKKVLKQQQRSATWHQIADPAKKKATSLVKKINFNRQKKTDE